LLHIHLLDKNGKKVQTQTMETIVRFCRTATKDGMWCRYHEGLRSSIVSASFSAPWSGRVGVVMPITRLCASSRRIDAVFLFGKASEWHDANNQTDGFAGFCFSVRL